MANRSIAVTLRAEISQYKRAMEEASQATVRVGKDADKASKDAADAANRQKADAQDLVRNYTMVGTSLMAVGGAITAMSAATLKSGIAYNQLQQQSRAALTTLLGGAEAANAQMDKLDTFARTSPFSKQTFITAQQQMLAFGIEAQKVVPYLDAIQDAVAAAGGGSQQVGEIAFIMSQISSASKITAMDLKQFGVRGINAAELIGSQMGKTGAQIREEITTGTLDADAALDALAAGMEARFDGAAANVKNTFTGALDRVSAAWRDLSASIAEPLVGKEGGGLAVGGLNLFADVLRDVEKLPQGLKYATAGFAGLSGVAMLAAGSFLTLAPRIHATREALESMGSGANFAYSSATRVTKAVGLMTAAFVAASAAGSFFENLDKYEFGGPEAWTGGLLDAIDGTAAGLERMATIDASGPLGWNRNAVNGLADAFQKASDAKTQLDLSFGHESGLERGTAIVANVDAALAKLVNSGNLEQAEQGFKFLMGDTGMTKPELLELMPQYADAIAGLGNEARLAGRGVTSLAQALGMTDEELAAMRESVAKQAELWNDFTGAVERSKGSLAAFMEDRRKQAENLVAFTENLIKANKMGLDQSVVEQIREMGPGAGADFLAEVVKGGKKAVKELNAVEKEFGAAMDGFNDSLGGTPGVIETTLAIEDQTEAKREEIRKKLDDIARMKVNPVIGVKDETGGAFSRIRAWMTQLSRGINVPVTATSYTPRGQQKADGGFVTAYADGGIDTFGRTVPRIPMIREAAQGAVLWGEPETGWEAYISGKRGKEERNRQIWMQAGQRLGMLNQSILPGAGGASSAVLAGGATGPVAAGPAMFTGTLVLDSGEFMGKVSGVAIQAAESTSANVQRFDRSQASAWR